MTTNFLATFFIFFLYFQLLYGDNKIDKNSLTLQQAIELLRENNQEIAIANRDLEIEKNKLASINGYKLGKLDLVQNVMRTNDSGDAFGFKLSSREATFNDFGFDQFLAGMGTIEQDGGASLLKTQPKYLNYPEATNYFKTELKYELPIYTGGKLSAGEKMAQKMTEISSLSRDKIIDEKIYELRRSYSDMALLNATIQHLSIISNNLKTLENIANNLIKEGYGKDVDLLEVKARKSAVERMIAQSQSRRELLYKYISFLVGSEITQIETFCTDHTFKNISIDNFLAENLDIKTAQKGLEISEQNINFNRSEFLPKVGAFGKISTADNNFLNEADRHASWTIGVQMSWNLFNGGIDEANLEEAKLKKLKTQEQIKLAESGLKLQFETISTEIKNLNDEIIKLNSELDLTNQIYKNYEEFYRENLKPMSDVIVKQSEQLQKIMELLQLRNKRNERVFALQKLYHKN